METSIEFDWKNIKKTCSDLFKQNKHFSELYDILEKGTNNIIGFCNINNDYDLNDESQDKVIKFNTNDFSISANFNEKILEKESVSYNNCIVNYKDECENKHGVIQLVADINNICRVKIIFNNICFNKFDNYTHKDISKIHTVVYLYCQNRSFNNLYGTFPKANGINNASYANTIQLDRDNTPFKVLPCVWESHYDNDNHPNLTEEKTTNLLSNMPFFIDDPNGLNVQPNEINRDLVHRFYQNQMQINNGNNNKFVAWSDAGCLPMSLYDGKKLPLWDVAKKYTLADNFFQGGFGGSFFNHQYIILARAPYRPNADTSPSKDLISVVDNDGVTLTLDESSAKSALDGPPIFKNDGALTPDFYYVNTIQPPYQPSDILPAKDQDPRFADPSNPETSCEYTEENIGDLLNEKNISWAFWSGGFQAALDGNNKDIYFQTHHQSFNYYKNMAPGTKNREDHIKDAGIDGVNFIKAIDEGKLPQFSYYVPQGTLNMHAGYAEISSGNDHMTDIISHLEKSPQWKNMLVVLTFDENGGYWDHVSPPKGDRWGPGSRIPALIISPFAKSNFVDSTQYDSASILRFITKRFKLRTLTGITERDEALIKNGHPPMGDLTNALDL